MSDIGKWGYYSRNWFITFFPLRFQFYTEGLLLLVVGAIGLVSISTQHFFVFMKAKLFFLQSELIFSLTKIIIFRSLLTTFRASIIFWGNWSNSKLDPVSFVKWSSFFWTYEKFRRTWPRSGTAAQLSLSPGSASRGSSTGCSLFWPHLMR